MMKIFKKVLISVLLIVLMFTLTACGCEHEWQAATCINPKSCALCGITEGEALESSGHNFVDGCCTHCCQEDPNYFDAENFGFINDYNMYTWVEITSYSIGEENANATYDETATRYKYKHQIYKFKDGTVYSYNRFESGSSGQYYGVDHKNLTQKLNYTSNYTIINNDSIVFDGKTLTILERDFDNNGNIVIKAMLGSKEELFILEEQIDWDKSPEIEAFEGIYAERFTYYFK